MTRLSAFPHAALDALGEALPGVFYELVWREDLPAPEAVLRASWYRGNAGTGVFVPERVGGRVAGILGERPEDILGDPGWWYRRLHPEDLPHAVENLGRLWRRGRLVQRYRIVRPDGRVVPVQDTMRLWRGPGGEPRIAGMWVDITDHELDRELLSRAFEISPHAMIVTTLREGRLLAANETFELLSGRARMDCIGRTLAELGLWEDARVVRRMVGLLVRHGCVRGARLILRRADGERRHCEVHASRLEIMGEPCVLIEAADVTERVTRERLLAEHEARWRALLENLPDGVLVHDAERVLYANPGAEEMFGGILVGAPVERLVLPEDMETARMHLFAARSGLRKTTRLRMLRMDGTPFPAEVRTASLKEEGTAHFLCVVRDRSAQEAMEARMREMQHMRAVATLAGGVAHDFNNVLAAINGNLYLLRRALADDPALLAKLQRIEDASERAAAMIAQLLSFARRREGEAEVLDLRVFLKETAKLVRAAVPEAVAFSLYDASEGGPVTVRVDAGQLQQIVLNLVKNAQDAVQGRPEPRIRLMLCTEPPPDAGAGESWACICCEDNGPGIPEALLDRVFDPFFTTKPEGQGTGLGLAVVRQVAEAHGGRCGIENRPEGGVRVYVWFPVVRPKERVRPDGPDVAPPGRGETVLLVDDNAPLRTALAEALLHLGYRVAEAGSVEEAIARFEALEGRVDALVSDIVMPGGDGCTLVRALKARRPGLAVILQTGYGEAERMGCDCAEEGATLLQKPVRVDVLARVLAEKLEQARRAA